MGNQPEKGKTLTISDLLKPHTKALAVGLLAVVGEGIVNILEPWPLKIILDNVLRSRPTQGWFDQLILSTIGDDKLAILKFAAVAVLVIAAIGAICSYTEKYVTTNVGQWVMHDLRQTLYFHIQRLSLSFHDQSRTGDLISRVTSDIDTLQSFITSGLLGALANCLTLVGMVGVMFYLNWRFTLNALSVAPVLFLVVYVYTRRIKKASRELRRKEGEIVSIVQEVFSSIHVVKAFAREGRSAPCNFSLRLRRIGFFLTGAGNGKTQHHENEKQLNPLAFLPHSNSPLQKPFPLPEKCSF